MSTLALATIVLFANNTVDIKSTLASAEKDLQGIKENFDKEQAAIVKAVDSTLKQHAGTAKFSTRTFANMAISSMGKLPDDGEIKRVAPMVAVYLDSKPETFLRVGGKGPSAGYWVRANLKAEQLAKLTATSAKTASEAVEA